MKVRVHMAVSMFERSDFSSVHVDDSRAQAIALWKSWRIHGVSQYDPSFFLLPTPAFAQARWNRLLSGAASQTEHRLRRIGGVKMGLSDHSLPLPCGLDLFEFQRSDLALEALGGFGAWRGVGDGDRKRNKERRRTLLRQRQPKE